MKVHHLLSWVALMWATQPLFAVAAEPPKLCRLEGATRVPDKLEAFVFSGTGQSPACPNGECCLSRSFREIVITERAMPNSVWTRAVKFDHLSQGISGKTFTATLVETDGRDIGLSTEFSLENVNIITDKDGFGFLPVVVRFTSSAPTAKVYLTKFIYSDLDGLSYSYGPYFYVTDRATPRHDLRDRLMMRGFTVRE